MSILDITVEDAALIILDDLNNAKDVFPLTQANTVDLYPFYQALKTLKDKGLITTPDPFEPQQHQEYEQHRVFEISVSPNITLDGIDYLNAKEQKALSARNRFAGINEQQAETELKKTSLGMKILKNVPGVTSTIAKFSKDSETTVGTVQKIIESFKDHI
jgi:hypothetical protein